ncbi:MAG: two-component regulator propeller domain-containing protein, partial [Chitinophagaceae bacterium]
MTKFRIIFILFIQFGVGTFAQPTAMSFKNISINEGLSQNSVVDIAIDSAGFIWLATQDGLNRYDGKEFVIFKKNFDDITTPSVSKLGKIIPGNAKIFWLITSGGQVEMLDLLTNSFIKLNMATDSNKLPVITTLLNDTKNILWIGTERNGIFSYDLSTNKLSRRIFVNNNGIYPNVQSIFQDAEEFTWVATSNGLWQTLKDQKSVYFLSTINCSVITKDQNKTAWAGTLGSGIYYKKNGTNDFIQFTGYGKNAELPPGLVIETILVDKHNRLWIGTYGKGLYIVDQINNTIRNFIYSRKDPYSIGFNDVLCIKEDVSGGIWIGTDGGGVSYYHESNDYFPLYSIDNLPENISIAPVRSITTTSKGNIWAGTSSSGLTELDPRNNTHKTIHFAPFNKEVTINERVVSLVADGDEDIWAGTQGNGLIILNSETKEIKKWFHPGATGKNKIPDNTVWCMYRIENSKVWAGTRNSGLCLIDKNSGLEKVFMKHQGSNSILENNIRTILPINDSVLCLGFENLGIQFFNRWSEKFYSPKEGSANNLENHTIRSLHFEYPLLWIGTLGNGLIALNTVSGDRVAITDKQGLPNNTVYAILSDRFGVLWLSSNKGICRFNPPLNLNKVNHTNFNVFTDDDGLQSNEFNTGAYHKSSDGMLYFGGIKGLNKINPVNFRGILRPMEVMITNVTIDNLPIATDTNLAYKQLLELSYKNNSIAFNFASLDFASPGQYNFYYQMDGYDKEWIDAGNRSYASYTNLPPGKYVFKVKAVNNLSAGPDKIKTIVIKIKPPFWITWWFISLTIILITSLVYLLVRRRIKQIHNEAGFKQRLAESEMMALRAQMNPHFIFNSITAIDNLIQTNQKDKATIYLTRFAQLIRSILDSSKNNLIPAHKDVESLKLFLQLEQFRYSDKFRYNLSVDPEILNSDIKVPPLIIQPFVENAINHGLMNKESPDRELNIEICLQNDYLKYTVTDNGIGRQRAEELKSFNKPGHVSYGIEISTKRIDL